MKVILLTLTFLYITQTFAQIDVNELTVQKAISIALKNNPTINQLKEKINQTTSQYWKSFGLPSPSLIYLKEGINQNTKSNFAEQRWTLEQTLDFPLKTIFRLKKIRNEKAALLYQLEAEKLKLIAEVKSKYTDILYAKELMNLALTQIQITTQLKNAVITRVEVGESSELELMRADIRLAEANNDFDDAERLYHNSRYELFKMIGLKPEEQKYTISFIDSLRYFEIVIDQEEIIHRIEDQPEYKSIINSLDASNDAIKEAWSSFLPDLSFSYYKQDYGSGYNFFGFQIGLKIPVWFVFNQNGEIQTANAIKREYLWKQNEILLEMKNQIEKAWHSYEASKLTIRRFMDIIQVKANELLNKTLEGYQVGEIDFLSLIDAQQTYLSSRKRYLAALHDYYLQLINLEKFMNTQIIFK